MFFHEDALAEHRKLCKVWTGEPKPKDEPKPDLYDNWPESL
jgi:hypothetical protein